LPADCKINNNEQYNGKPNADKNAKETLGKHGRNAKETLKNAGNRSETRKRREIKRMPPRWVEHRTFPFMIT
jgi:hypothetical protein